MEKKRVELERLEEEKVSARIDESKAMIEEVGTCIIFEYITLICICIVVIEEVRIHGFCVYGMLRCGAYSSLYKRLHVACRFVLENYV